MRKGRALAIVAIFCAAIPLAVQANYIAGVPIGSSYYGANSLTMWRVDTSSVVGLGTFDLRTALGFGAANITFYDTAFMSDGRVAILYDNASGARTLSVLNPTISGNSLTGVSVDASFSAYDGTHALPNKIAGTSSLGIVTASTGLTGTGDIYFYRNTGASSWSFGNYVAAAVGNTFYDITGITDSSRETIATTWYGGHSTFANVSGTFSKVKTFKDSTYGGSVEGINDARLANGWVSAGSHPGSYWHTLIMDQNDSATTANLCRGRITNGADPSPGTRPPNGIGALENRLIQEDLAGLSDGRVVLMDGGASLNNKTFHIYTLLNNTPEPGTATGAPAGGEIGATAEDFHALTQGATGTFHGYIAGDFLVTVPEPATLVFLALGGVGMAGAAVRRRRSA